ncbi:MAG TPA: lipid-A-disaccharide synthase [Xanthomonadaceae bacterium]|nr:lipid-A-disaccharide synthase [Xanthomonadaceae bacterium]
MSGRRDVLGSTSGTVATSAARRVRVALVAGEASGDLLGAGLLDALRGRLPDAEFAGIGGNAMRAAGLHAWHDCSELAVMGLSEVLRHLPRLLRLRRDLRARLLDWRPDVFVGIDAPDFNLGLERKLRQRGIRTVHYVSPSVWAWREGRAARIGESADRVLCLFPMEPPIYARHGVDARFVGHPLADSMPLEPDRAAARARFGLPMHDHVLAVLPGSRLGEIERMGPVFLDAAARVAAARPGLAVLVPAANAACRALLERQVADAGIANVRLLDGDARPAMVAADVVLLASGTAALEAMLAKRPMVVGHRIAPLTHSLVRGLGMLKTRFVSLPNVLAGEALVPELLQDDCTPSNLADAVLHWFEQPEAAAALRPRFRTIHETLRRDASASAADAVVELLGATR